MGDHDLLHLDFQVRKFVTPGAAQFNRYIFDVLPLGTGLQQLRG